MKRTKTKISKGNVAAGTWLRRGTALVVSFGLVVLFPQGASAYYNDIELSGGNTLNAGSLDFSLTNKNITEYIGLVEKISWASVLTNSGTLAFTYTATTEEIGGNPDFCDALNLEAVRNGVEEHDGDLLLLNVSESAILGTWNFEIQMPLTASNISHGETCRVDIVFEGWQDNFPSYPDGFSDEERIQIDLKSRMVVLNEFLPRPDRIAYGFDFGNDSSNMPQGEWVELYNNSDFAEDLTGWYIWDDSGSQANKIGITATSTMPATTTIPAKGWLVVFMNKAVLNNTGDSVKLFDNNDNLIDLKSYSDADYCEIEPTPGDENSTTTTGDCGGVPPNKSYARIPDGIGAWVDPVPTPGGRNILFEGPAYTISLQAKESTPPVVSEVLGELEPEGVDEQGEIVVEDSIGDGEPTEEISTEDSTVVGEAENAVNTNEIGTDSGEEEPGDSGDEENPPSEPIEQEDPPAGGEEEGATEESTVEEQGATEDEGDVCELDDTQENQCTVASLGGGDPPSDGEEKPGTGGAESNAQEGEAPAQEGPGEDTDEEHISSPPVSLETTDSQEEAVAGKEESEAIEEITKEDPPQQESPAREEEIIGIEETTEAE